MYGKYLSFIYFSLFLLKEAAPVHAQYYNQQYNYLQANSIWAFGNKAGLDFNSGTAVGIQTMLNNGEGATAVADPLTGNLLFYSDGYNCWDVNHQVMPNGSGLLGNGRTGSTSQGVCIVPVIDSAGKYYLFSLNYQGSLPALYYSIVDMSLNNGLGDIVPGRKNIILYNEPLSEAMIAIPGENCDLWLMVHENANPVFQAFHITRDGLDTVPVVSNTGVLIGPGAYLAGCMAVSPDRTKIAIASYNCPAGALPEEMGVLLAKFDAATGRVDNGIKLLEEGIYGVSFSPDNTKLYASSIEAPIVRQFDVSIHDSATIAASGFIIPGLLNPAPYLRLYNDTIYLSQHGESTLSKITRPNLSGIACDFQANAVVLAPNTRCMYTLGADVAHPMLPDTMAFLVLDTLICSSNESARFEEPVALTATPAYYAYEWDDGTTAQQRTITEAGTYWVLCKDSCHSRIDTFHIRHTNIYFSLGADTILCDEQSYVLSAFVPDATYLWNDGSTDSVLTVRESGHYFVTVYKEGCSAADSINIYSETFIQYLGNDTIVCKGDPFQLLLQANVPQEAEVRWSTGSKEPAIIVQDSGTYWVSVSRFSCFGSDTLSVKQEICTCNFQTPNAFTPNGDGTNDLFLPVIETGCPVQGYVLSIYNRYGERIFSNNNPHIGWDGTYKGLLVDAGTYYYEIKFEGGTYNQHYYQKGDLTLIR